MNRQLLHDARSNIRAYYQECTNGDLYCRLNTNKLSSESFSDSVGMGYLIRIKYLLRHCGSYWKGKECDIVTHDRDVEMETLK